MIALVVAMVCLTVVVLAEMWRRTLWRLHAPAQPDMSPILHRLATLEAKQAKLEQHLRSHDGALAKRVRA